MITIDEKELLGVIAYLKKNATYEVAQPIVGMMEKWLEEKPKATLKDVGGSHGD